MTAAHGQRPAEEPEPAERQTAYAGASPADEIELPESQAHPGIGGRQQAIGRPQFEPGAVPASAAAAGAATAALLTADFRPPPVNSRAEGVRAASARTGFASWRERIAGLRGPEEAPASRRPARTVGLGQILCWQVVAAGLIASIGQHWRIVAATVALAVGVLAVSTVRIRGRWLYQWLARAVRFALRERHRAVPPGSELADHLVDAVAHDTVVETVDVGGVPVALIHQPAGVTAVLEPHAAGAPREAGLTLAELNLSSPESLLPPADVDAPAFAAQMIMQVAQGPDPRAPVAGSFGIHRGTQRRRTWITLQALRSADFHRDDDLTPALANAVRRLVRRLARDELPIRTLDRDEALTLVVGLSVLNEAAASGPDPVTLRESWTAWEAGQTIQAGFRISGWQEASEAERQFVLRRLHLVPSLATTVAIAARRAEHLGEAQVDVVVRLAETSRTLLDSSADLLAFAIDPTNAVQETGADIRLERLDGDHLAAVVASLPFGGSGPRP